MAQPERRRSPEFPRFPEGTFPYGTFAEYMRAMDEEAIQNMVLRRLPVFPTHDLPEQTRQFIDTYYTAAQYLENALAGNNKKKGPYGSRYIAYVRAKGEHEIYPDRLRSGTSDAAILTEVQRKIVSDLYWPTPPSRLLLPDIPTPEGPIAYFPLRAAPIHDPTSNSYWLSYQRVYPDPITPGSRVISFVYHHHGTPGRA